MRHWLSSPLAPERFHGHTARPPYFEGWYFKVVDAALQRRFAVIPGLFLDPAGADSHAFVQTLDGATGRTHYHRFPLDEFVAQRHPFRLRVGPNLFSRDEMALDLDGQGSRMLGAVRFHGVQGWPVSLASPGVMGWYGWVPRMECYHGVLSFDHALSGQLIVDGTPVDLHGGRGYIEKDWGQAFPRAWVWMQSNHFGAPGVCLTASVARIPWAGQAFRGFIVGLWLEGQLYRFATYTGARIERLEVGERSVECALRGPVALDGRRRPLRLQLHARRTGAAPDLLHAPMRTAMLARVLESLDAEISVQLSEADSGRLLFERTGHCAGLELGGDLNLIR